MWLAFWQLEQARQTPFEAPQPFSYVEIDAWCRLTGQTLAPWELAAIMEMDVARRVAIAESQEVTQTPEGVRRTVSLRDVKTAESLFDSFGTVIDC